MRGFVRTLGQKPKVLFTGFVIVGSKFVYLTPLLAGIGRLLNISNIFTTRTVGVVALSSRNAFAVTNFLLQFEPVRPTRQVVGFVGGAIGCLGLRPIVRGTNGSVWIGRMPKLRLSRWHLSGKN